MENFSLNDDVKITVDPMVGEKGKVVIIDESRACPYGVVFPWDVTSQPFYFEATELERVINRGE